MSEIVRTEGILGGDPRIEGHRIGVHHVVESVLEGKYTVDEVAYTIYPQLSVEDVHASLAYYYAHREEIEERRERARREVRESKKRAITGPDDLPADATQRE